MLYIFVFILLYCLLVFVDIRLVVPYYGFLQPKIPRNIPEYWLRKIQEISNKSVTQEELVKNVYNFLTNKYYGGRWEIFVYAPDAFRNAFTKEKGFLPCNVFNQLFRIMLVASGRFEAKDVRTQVVFLNFFIHQYLKIHIEEKWITVDPTYAKMGVPFGEYARGFR